MRKLALISSIIAITIVFASCGNTEAQDAAPTTATVPTTNTPTTTTEITTTTAVTTTAKPETTTTTTAETTKPWVEPKVNTDGEDLSSNDMVQTKTEKKFDIEEDKEDVTITIPVSWVGDDPQAYINKMKNEEGVISAGFNDEGNIDIVFTKQKYKEACEQIKLACEESIDKIASSGQYPTITDVTYNSDLTDFYVKVTDYDEYSNGMDAFSTLAIKIVAGTYHMYVKDDATLYLHILDQDGNEITSSELN